MARAVNFLLANGERLTSQVEIRRGSGDKNPPYSVDQAKERISERLAVATRQFSDLPAAACPGDQVVGILTMHPRYTAKSEFPKALLDQVQLSAVGSRARLVKPEQWGLKREPEDGLGIGEDIFVSGTREAFQIWQKEVYDWHDKRAIAQLTQIEGVDSFRAGDKVKGVPQERNEAYFEVVLHCQAQQAVTRSANNRIVDAFEAYALALECQPLMDRASSIKGVTFIPVYAPVAQIESLAAFAFVRVARGMPAMRPARPTIIRTITNGFPVSLPNVDSVAPDVRAVVFDGGLPSDHLVSQWVDYIEPAGIGPASPSYQAHGYAVTSALLFGPLEAIGTQARPLCSIDHVRVLDVNSGGAGDLECYDVLDRITGHLNSPDTPDYPFVGLSIGPDFAVDDDDISRWTVELDQQGAAGKRLITAAAGNNGRLDAASGSNRVQPPADGVNVLSIGASDSQNFMWQRADYSGIGPGRCPGLIKPDGVVFGGSDAEPFNVLSADNPGHAEGQMGTSFAGPLALRSGVAVRAQLGTSLSPMAIRALMLHRADRSDKETVQVGWGRFETDPDALITCDDDEALVVYQGELPVMQHLRAIVPLPDGPLPGRVTIAATLIIAPDVDPAHPNAYTRGGIEVMFRPNEARKYKRPDGSFSIHAKTSGFFSPQIMWGRSPAYTYVRGDAHKWEPCQKGVKQFNGSSLNQPVFDIYNHQRSSAGKEQTPKPITYSLVISVKAPLVSNYYNRVVRQYAGILQQLQPINRVSIRGTHSS